MWIGTSHIYYARPLVEMLWLTRAVPTGQKVRPLRLNNRVVFVYLYQCGEPVYWAALPNHKADSCPNRYVNCHNTGCMKKMPLYELEQHELHECK